MQSSASILLCAAKRLDSSKFRNRLGGRRHDSAIACFATLLALIIAPEIHMTSLDNDVITKDPEVLGGVPVFRGTRVPFQSLLEYLEGGQTIDEFLDDFPTVSREAAVRALEHAKSLVVSQLR
jgi:uncharacterized protein (DUF433 family)